MFKRSYFMSVEKPHDDGNNSYPYNSAFVTHPSFLPQHKIVYDNFIAGFEEKLKDFPGVAIKVVCFSKL